jgi:cytochrome b561
MSEDLLPGRQGRYASMLGWAIALTFLVLFWNTINLPRTPLDQRSFLREMHNSLGFIVLLLSIVKLWTWSSQPRARPPPGLPPASFAFNRAILLALVLTFAATGVIGFVYSWADGQEVVLFGIHLPRLVQPSWPLRTTVGYLHSSLGFYYLMLFSIWIVFGLYQHARYSAGLLRLLPGSRI